jgi:hypothetical protein
MMARWKKFDAALMALSLRERLLGTLLQRCCAAYLGYQLLLDPLYRSAASCATACSSNSSRSVR